MSTFNKPSISNESALAIIAKAKEEAAAIGINVCVAVVDESGILKAFERMDGAALVTVASSQDKAYTAVGFGLASKSWYGMIKDDPALLHGVPAAMDRLVIFGGGVPLVVDGSLVGAVGVGGGSHHQDHDIADKASKAVG
jgi:uncharacterized protein GlcG (DUF336 family)